MTTYIRDLEECPNWLCREGGACRSAGDGDGCRDKAAVEARKAELALVRARKARSDQAPD